MDIYIMDIYLCIYLRPDVNHGCVPHDRQVLKQTIQKTEFEHLKKMVFVVVPTLKIHVQKRNSCTSVSGVIHRKNNDNIMNAWQLQSMYENACSIVSGRVQCSFFQN